MTDEFVYPTRCSTAAILPRAAVSECMAVAFWRKDDRNSQLRPFVGRSSGVPCVHRDVAAHSGENGPAE